MDEILDKGTRQMRQAAAPFQGLEKTLEALGLNGDEKKPAAPFAPRTATLAWQYLALGLLERLNELRRIRRNGGEGEGDAGAEE
jgi:hypothetical protein